MKARATAVLLGSVVLMGSAAAQEGADCGAAAVAGRSEGGGETSEVTAAEAERAINVVPWIARTVPGPTRDKLTAAFAVAVARVHASPECRALFTTLGADPVRTLATTLYQPANPYKETTRCRSALAFTYVGVAPTWLCRGFGFLSDEDATMVILHEALHHAGLSERPSDPSGMSAGAIDGMVRRACQ